MQRQPSRNPPPFPFESFFNLPMLFLYFKKNGLGNTHLLAAKPCNRLLGGKKRSEKIFLCYYTSVHICVHIDSY